MRHVLAVALVVAGATRGARADTCNYHDLFRTTAELPLGCPLVAYAHAGIWPFTPVVTAKRNILSFDATGPFTTSSTTLPVWFETLDEDCVQREYFGDEPYVRISIEIEGPVVVGDLVYLESNVPVYGTYATYVYLGEAGPCPTADEPIDFLQCQDFHNAPYCSGMDVPPDEPVEEDTGDQPEPPEAHDHRVGCNAGSGMGLGVLAILLGMVAHMTHVRRRAWLHPLASGPPFRERVRIIRRAVLDTIVAARRHC